MNILNRLTIKHMMMNKKRTIVTIIGVILSSVLLFGIGFSISTLREKSMNDVIATNGKQHVIIKNYPYKELSKLEERNDIKILGYEKKLYEGEYNGYSQIHLVSYPSYEGIHLIAGEYPKKNEVIISKDFLRYQVSEKSELKIGSKITIENQVYTVSGIYDQATVIGYQYNPSYLITNSYLFTLFEIEKDMSFDVRIIFSDMKNIYEQIKNLGLELGYQIYNSGGSEFEFNEFEINHRLLGLYGQSGNSGQYAVFILSAMLLSTILGIVCVFVIYNSFMISISERKKMFGLLRSIGANPKQLFISVFFEAIVVGIIAIPVGFLLSVGMVYFALNVLNSILKNIDFNQYRLSLYPQYLWISLIFIIITLFFSCLFPAKRASEITPIESIQLQKDVKRKKIKNKWIYKLFGIEGELAYKNMKRNKHRYRVTTISICISIILFLTMSTYINYFLQGQKDIEQQEPDVVLSIPIMEKTNQIITQIGKISYIKDMSVAQTLHVAYSKLKKEYYTTEYYDTFLDKSPYSMMLILLLDDITYQSYLKKIGLKDKRPILYNTGNMEYNKGVTYKSRITVFDSKKKPQFSFCQYLNYGESLSNCLKPISDIYYTDISPMEAFNNKWVPGYVLVVDKNLFDTLSTLDKNSSFKTISINTHSIQKFDQQINQIIEQYPEVSISYQSIKLDRYQAVQVLNAFRFTLYSFIFLITLVAVTSVISTIYTSIQLRRREFAMLRSIGLSPKGLQKMLRLESVFFGSKALMIGLLISFGCIDLIQRIFDLSYGESKIKMPFPTLYVWICIIGVLCIVFFAMVYSTRKIKNDNIIDNMKQENI